MTATAASAMSAARITSLGCRRRIVFLRGGDPARGLRPCLLQLTLEVGDALLELALVVLKADHLTPQPPELLAQGVDVVHVLDFGFRPARGRRRPPNRDLHVGGPSPRR